MAQAPTAFPVDRLPRAELLAQAFPGQDLHASGWGKVRCTLPGCQHKNEDRDPSLRLNVEGGGFECLTNGAQGRGWKDFVSAWFGEDRWREVLREVFPREDRGRMPTMRERWEALAPEREWTERYSLRPELSARYLRSGRRAPKDPLSQSVIGLWRGDELRGIKWRLPAGARWQQGEMGRRHPTAKYALTPKSDAAVLFLAELARRRPNAEVLVCAGEKDALVAASHLPARWAPVSGCYGEGKMPWEGLRQLVAGRRVLVAYDGDDAGHHGAWTVVHHVAAVARAVRAAMLPGGKDLADVFLEQGADALAELLDRAGQVPPSWRPPHLPPGANLPADPPPPPRDEEPPEGEDEGEQVEGALDDWAEVGGQVVQYVNRGRGKGRRQVAIRRFAGLPRIESVRTVYTEDPDQPTGWLEEQAVTYRFRLSGGRVVERKTSPGPGSFESLLDHTHLAAATEAIRRDDRRKLFLWTQQQSARCEEVRERRAVGPHRGLGWLAPPAVAVREGEVLELDETVGPPSEAEEFRRYRLDVRGDVRALGRFVVEDLLTCDHGEQRYTLPLLGAFLSAPLWTYVRALRSWQRFVVFVQGESGVGKSVLCRYFWSFWGDFVDGQGLTTWLSSATYLEEILHHACGVPVFVSDWKRANFSRDALRSAMALIQAYADRSSRGRAKRGSSDVERKRPPRCAWIIDGEDLPEGEQSTLGRMVVVEVLAGKHGRCATVDHLAPRMVQQLPALTARWIAWVQRNAEHVGGHLEQVTDALAEELPHGSTNRSRIVRNYAVQIVAAQAFLHFLEQEAGVPPQVELRDRVWSVNVELAARQLSTVSGESAGDQFLRTLAALLTSGAVHLRAEEKWSGANPFPGHSTSQACVGTYDGTLATIWPDVAVPLVNQHLCRGGGSRIEFSRRAIQQQLSNAEVIDGTPRKRVDGHPSGKARLKVWEMSLRQLGWDGAEQAELYEEDADAQA